MEAFTTVIKLYPEVPINVICDKFSQDARALRCILKSLTKALPKSPRKSGYGWRAQTLKPLAIDSIQPDKGLESEIRRWASQHESFFGSSLNDNQLGRRPTLQKLYGRLRRNDINLGINLGINDVHRRFELFSLFEYAKNKGCHNGRHWRKGGKGRLVREILTLEEKDEVLEEAEKTLDHFVGLGRSFSEWVDELGHPGFLILLPTQISESV